MTETRINSLVSQESNVLITKHETLEPPERAVFSYSPLTFGPKTDQYPVWRPGSEKCDPVPRFAVILTGVIAKKVCYNYSYAKHR